MSKNSGGSPPKNWGQKDAKFRSILYNLTLWSWISPGWVKISKIGKIIDWEQFLLRYTKKVWWLWSTNYTDLDVRLDPLNALLLETIFRPSGGAAPSYFLHALQIDTKPPRLASAHPRGGGGPPPKINRENLNFGLKFTVLGSLTSGLLGVSSRNFFSRRAARQEW